MINIHIPSKREKKFNVTDLIPYKEIDRRNTIIKNLWSSCPYFVGELVRPLSDEDFKAEGLYTVQSITKDWFEFAGKEKFADIIWPKHDNPMIVTAIQQSNGKYVNATVNYFVKAPVNAISGS